MKIKIIGIFLVVILTFVFVVQRVNIKSQKLYSLEVLNLKKEANNLNTEFKKLQNLLPIGKTFTYLNNKMICTKHVISSARTLSAWGTSHNFVQKPYIVVQYKTKNNEFTNGYFYNNHYDLLKEILK